MNDIVNEILNNTDIVSIISKYVALKKTWSNFSWSCPFHNEKTPSFIVSPQKQIFKCFGCWIWWNVINFIKEIEKVDFRDAIKILAEHTNIDMSKYEKKFETYKIQKDNKEKIKYINKLWQKFFVSELEKNNFALNYLKNNRNLNLEIIKKFWIWYAPKDNKEIINFFNWYKINNQDLIEASLMKKKSDWYFFPFFKNRIMFPIFDTIWNVIAFSWRVLDKNDKPKYLNSMEHIAFDKSSTLYWLNIVKENLKKFWRIIIVEWQMDVIACYKLWFPIAVATSWTSITKNHIKLLKRYSDNITLAFDHDEAWLNATIRALKMFYQWNIFPKTIILPEWIKDIDELANTKNWKEKFEKILNESKDWFHSITEIIKKSYNLNSPIDKQKYLNKMFEIIISLDNASIQMDFIHYLSEKTSINNEVLLVQYKQYAKNEWRFFLKQNIKKEKLNLYKPNMDIMFSSLFYENLIKKLIWEENEIIDNLIDSVNFLTNFIWEWTIKDIIENKINEEIQQKIKESQLRWEQELNEFKAIEYKIKSIKNLISPIIKKYLMQINKNKNIDPKSKMEILNKIKKIKR